MTVGTFFSYAIHGSYSPSSYNATGCPPGLTMAPNGLISGTPTTAGIYYVTISATNTTGTGSATLTITIQTPPVITGPASANGTVNVPFSCQMAFSGSPTSFSATGLPSGLSINSTGLISGTPTVAGNSTATIMATNAYGTGSAQLAVSIGNASNAVLKMFVPTGQ